MIGKSSRCGLIPGCCTISDATLLPVQGVIPGWIGRRPWSLAAAGSVDPASNA